MERSLVVLSDAAIHSLVMNPQVQEQFACMAEAGRRMRNSAPKCGKCGSAGSRAAASSTPDYNGLKRCIVGSGAARIKWLKQFLNAKKLRYEYVSESGKRVLATF